MVAHVPVSVPTAEGSERISVCERIPDLLASSAALIRASISIFLSVTVVLRVVVVIAGRGEGGQLGGSMRLRGDGCTGIQQVSE